MSTPHGCNDDSDVVETFKEALKQRVGEDRFQIWFSGVTFSVETEVENTGEASTSQPLLPGAPSSGRLAVVATTSGQFAADRLSKHYLQAMRGAAASTFGQTTPVRVAVDAVQPQQVALPFEEDLAANDDSQSASDAATNSVPGGSPANQGRQQRQRQHRNAQQASVSRGGGRTTSPQSLANILRDGTDSRKPAASPSQSVPTQTSQAIAPANSPETDVTPAPATLANSPTLAKSSHRSGPASRTNATTLRTEYLWENFVAGDCNELARAACRMAIETPSMASPLVLWGPPGCGKTHLLGAVANKLRSIHRMRRVVYLSAEEFTNDFIKALNTNSLPSFRLRFRDADALLIDDIQFFVEKKATIRELHHTIEMLAESGKPLLFAGTRMPSEIKGLDGQLSGRLAAGLVCQVETLDANTRMAILQRYASERCPTEWPPATLHAIAEAATGDGRVLSGIVNLVSLLQRMNGAMPTLDQIRQHGAHLLRSAGTPITLSSISRAVEKVFGLEAKSLQSNAQTKTVTEPRMLAMYLSRELTSSAYSEIGGHFGGRSHSTAILANQRVRQWLGDGRTIGRGNAALATEEAIRRIESILKTG